jgi:hypothetical protein
MLPLVAEPAATAPAPVSEPKVVTPARAAVLAAVAEPAAAAPLRIVDPSAAEDDDDLYPPISVRSASRGEYRSNPPPAIEHRRAPPKNPLPDPRTPPEKKGWLTLFGGGRAREELAHPQNHSDSPLRLQEIAPKEHAGETDPVADDLDIPSFLRRLAN